MKQEKILITGANGQLGSVLVKRLQEKNGVNNVFATDILANEDFVGNFGYIQQILQQIAILE